MSIKHVSTIAIVMSIFVTPAMADDAGKAAVLRDIGKAAPRATQPFDANALVAPPPVRAPRPAQARQRPPDVLVNDQPFDFSRIGHN